MSASELNCIVDEFSKSKIRYERYGRIVMTSYFVNIYSIETIHRIFDGISFKLQYKVEEKSNSTILYYGHCPHFNEIKVTDEMLAKDIPRYLLRVTRMKEKFGVNVLRVLE